LKIELSRGSCYDPPWRLAATIGFSSTMEAPIQVLPLKEELEAVEERLRLSLDSQVRIVAELGSYLYATGGKRFRPALAILFYKLLGERGPKCELIELATVLELIHLATLVHDDVIDESEERRGGPSLWKAWSNRMAVLQGDFIFSRVFKLLNRQEERLRLLIIETVEQLLEGELLQEDLRWQIPTEEEYFEVIRRKTAALISAACTVGALLGDPAIPEEDLRAIRRAGVHLGTAYQLVDDLLDIFGDERLGKPTWKDRDEGWITLPFIRLLRRLPEGERERVSGLLRSVELSSLEKDYLLAQLEGYNIREESLRVAQEEVDRAKQLLSVLPETELRALLMALVDFVVERDK